MSALMIGHSQRRTADVAVGEWGLVRQKLPILREHLAEWLSDLR